MSNSLNPDQKEAVHWLSGPLLVFAGAGSGKTRVIVQRIKHMLDSNISARQIVALTFTNKSAKEMKERLLALVPKSKLQGITVSTFHSLGLKLLKENIEMAQGYHNPFSILSEEESANLYLDIYKRLKLDPTKLKEDAIHFHISRWKNSKQSVRTFALTNRLPYDSDVFTKIVSHYANSLRALNSVDFDDLILLPTEGLKENPEILKKIHSRFKHFLVDEFQDTNPAQYDLLRLLSNHTNNLCVVGDDDQSIYGWRGADIGIILNFQKDFPDCKSVYLQKNYRSTATILHSANAVISNNQKRVDKKLLPTGAEGDPLQLFVSENEKEEASLVADFIQDEILKSKRKPSDFAILFRTNFQSAVIEAELRARSIPHHVVGGYRFFDRKEVKDLIAYLRVIANPKDEISLLRIINYPKRGVGETTLERLHTESREKERDFTLLLGDLESSPDILPEIKRDTRVALHEFMEFIERYRKEFAKSKKPSSLIYTLIKELDFESEFKRELAEEKAIKAKMLNLSELVNMCAYMEENRDERGPVSLFDFLTRVALEASDKDEESNQGRVQLLTLHLSKGLEFNVVFLVGLEEGVIPAMRSLEESVDNDAALAEERRLFYVGITRARRKLFLSHSITRKRYGQVFDVEPSRFLAEIPSNLVERKDFADPETQQKGLTELIQALDAL